MESYKDSQIWKSLNRIWQACDQEIQQARKADFELLNAFIRNHTNFVDHTRQVNRNKQTNVAKKPPLNDGDDYEYLVSLSKPCQLFIREHKPNLYHSFMAILNSHSDEFSSYEHMVQFYMKKYQTKRPWLTQNESFVNEVAALCWDNFFSRRH